MKSLSLQPRSSRLLCVLRVSAVHLASLLDGGSTAPGFARFATATLAALLFQTASAAELPYAAFDYHTTYRGLLWWYPEWDPKLDHPREPMQKRDGYWRREFGGATVYVNPFAQPATVQEGGGFTLPAFDGKIVPRAKPQP